MERFLKRKFSASGGGDVGEESSTEHVSNVPHSVPEVDLNDLPWDPADRKRILEYHPNQMDEVRRKYLIRGPCQPRRHEFPRKKIGNKTRRFNPAWFDQYGNWLEYSVKVDKAFCLFCYLFRDYVEKQGGSDAFVTQGFCSWNKTERLGIHVGDVGSFHNRALKKCDDLLRQHQLIIVPFRKQSDIVENEYRIRLNASIDAFRHLLNSGLPFCGHDDVLNSRCFSKDMLKDIVHCFAQEVLKSIHEEIGDDVFGLLVDESYGVSEKKQMVVVLRYIDRCGIVKERCVGLVDVMEASALSLKSAIDSLFAEYGLSLKKVRAQGYDGASNMRGEFNGLKALILKENSSAYYAHCFAHKLHLVIVAVAKKHFGVGNFFDMISVLMNVVGASCKQEDMILESEKQKVEQAIGSGERETGSGERKDGSGLNQELSLIRARDTHWVSHYKTLLHLVELFSSVVEVLEYVEKEGNRDLIQRQAYSLQVYLKSFDCVFYLHLLLLILGVTDPLSQALQRKDHDILNAMSLVKSTKRQLQKLRDNGWDSLLGKISSFCEKHDLEMLNMEEAYVNPKNRRQKTNITYGHYYLVDCFYTIVDMQIQELNDRFDEINSELLICMASLNPHDSFREFDPLKLMRLAELYPGDFDFVDKMALEHQLSLYLDNMQHDERFANLNDLAGLARVMVETRKHLCHPLIYRLVKLALVLPVTTATVERCFSAMKLVKSDLRNRIGDDFLSDGLICAVEKEALANVTNEDVIRRFQNMKTFMELF